MPDHKFEPFDRVLVRGVTGIWLPDLCGKCFRNYAINRGMQEMEAPHE